MKVKKNLERRGLMRIREGVVDAVGARATGRILLKENSSFVFCGRSGSGKTSFIYRLLKNVKNMFTNKKGRKIHILYCYSSDQPLFDEMAEDIPDITFFNGLPSEEEIDKHTSPQRIHLILIVDDLMREVLESKLIFDFFTIKAHHQGTSVIFVSHNLYQQGKYSRSIALNASYFFLFENPRGADQIRTLSSQVFPHKKGAIVQAYKLAMERPYSYLLLDMTANVPDDVRMRTCILPDEVTRVFSFNTDD